MSALAPPADLRSTTSLLKALADENRLRILALLADGELCVCHIVDALGLSQPNVSQHLRVLKRAGVVVGERRGSWMHYRFVPEMAPERARVVQAVLASLVSQPPVRGGTSCCG